jgi:hypothetical protein
VIGRVATEIVAAAGLEGLARAPVPEKEGPGVAVPDPNVVVPDPKGVDRGRPPLENQTDLNMATTRTLATQMAARIGTTPETRLRVGAGGDAGKPRGNRQSTR